MSFMKPLYTGACCSITISVGKKIKLYICMCTKPPLYQSPYGLCEAPSVWGFCKAPLWGLLEYPHICRKKDQNVHMCVFICVWSPKRTLQSPLFMELHELSQDPKGLCKVSSAWTALWSPSKSLGALQSTPYICRKKTKMCIYKYLQFSFNRIL